VKLKPKKIFFLFLLFIPVVIIYLLQSETKREVIYEKIFTTIPQKEFAPIQKEVTPKKEVIITEEELPKEVNNKAPFLSQAPLGVWDKLHDEACEEASILIAHYWLQGEKEISKLQAEKNIITLSAFTRDEYPKNYDLNSFEIVEVAKRYFKYTNWEVINNPEIKDIKKELARGNILIAPVAGREINNPYFKTPGPLYHMLVITGYNKNSFITQDPGTKRGENFIYPQKTILNALHDFPGKKEEIKKGKSSLIKIPKN